MKTSQPLGTYAELLENPTPWIVRNNLTMGRCCLLEAVTQADFDLDILETSTVDLLPLLVIRSNEEVLFDCRHQFYARKALVKCFRAGGDLATAIRAVVNATQHAWSFAPTAECKKLAGVGGKPSFMSAFDPSRGGKAGLSQYAEALRGVAQDLEAGWSHPGLQIAGETLAALVGDQRRVEKRVSTLLMFAADHPLHPQGVLARLTLDRLPDGSGLLVPDPYYCGYMWMRRSFSTGLQNAWVAAHGCVSNLDWNPDGLHFDWRWRLDLLTATQKWSHKPAQVPMFGRSAEVALACAMLAAASGNPDAVDGDCLLDPHVAATASLGIESQEWKAGAFPAVPLEFVDAIKDKTLLGRMDSERLAAIVVANKQPRASLPIDPRFEFLGKETLGEAYTAMVRFPRISHAVNQAIIAAAGAELRRHCDPYIPSAIESRVEREEVQGAAKSLDGNNEVNWKPLDRIEKSQLTTARWWTTRSESPELDASEATEDGLEAKQSQQASLLGGSNRIWVCCESGLGKSMFILRCQMKVAKFGSGAVPIRVGRTSADDNALSDVESWEDLGAEELLRFLVEFLDAAYPPRGKNSLSREDRVAWMEWLLRNGKVVFLLDALDQSDRDMKDLSLFLSRRVPQCPTIVTGRMEAESNQGKAFRGTLATKWQTLRLSNFDRRRQTRYLGSELASQLLPEREEVDWQSDEEEKRRHQWKDLLDAPLLLKLMKDLAKASGSDSLKSIDSRYDLYDRAVQHLIDQAPSKIEVDSHRKLVEGDERELLEEIAWFMIRDHDVTNLLSGDRLAVLKKQFKARHVDLLDAVVRINLATLSQVVERYSSGVMAFRHRSFMEFFAGCYLARRAPLRERQELLEDIHKMLDAEGRWLSHAQVSADRPAAWLDTLRFALSAASADVRDDLGLKLIELGNPWCVYNNIDRDKAKHQSTVDTLVRWLVHRDRSSKFDFSGATKLNGGNSISEIDAQRALEQSGLDWGSMLARSTRDASWLSPLRDLGIDLNAYYVATSQASSLVDRMTCLPTGTADSTWNFLDSLVPVSGGTFDIGRYEDQKTSRKSIEQKLFKIPDFRLADFPVTNALFELFCPTHRRWRDQYSNQDDQPTIYVSYFMATEFCHWLSALTGQSYRLPTEWEWEWACRWLCGSENQHRHDQYWWGPEMDHRICWYSKSSNGSGTRSRSRAISTFKKMDPAMIHPSWRSALQPGLVDVLGNVWEWCGNLYGNIGSDRVYRGGSWLDSAGGCRSGYRFRLWPVLRCFNLGFRVSLVPSSQPEQESG